MEFRCRLAPPRARSSRGSTSPRPRRACGASSKRRGSTSSPCGRGGLSAGLGLPAAGGTDIAAPRVPGVQPGTRHAAQGRACRWSSRSTSCGGASPIRVFKAVLDDVHEKVRGGTALSDAFAAHGELFPASTPRRCWPGERSGNLDAVLRRFVAYAKVIATVKREDDLGAGLPGDPDRRWRSCSWSHHRAKVVPAFSDFYAQLRRRTAAGRRAIIVGDLGRRSRAVPADLRSRVVGAARGVRRRGCSSRARRRGSIALILQRAGASAQIAAQVRDVADGADAGDAARRRHPAGECARHRREVDRQPLIGARAGDRGAARARRGSALPARCSSAARVPGRGGQDGRSGRVDRRAAGHAEHRGRLLRRGDRDRNGRGSSTLVEPVLLVDHGHRHRRACCSRSTCRSSSSVRCWPARTGT